MPHYTASDGERLFVEILGKGTPLVFLHGWTSNHREWLPYAEALSDLHTCYCWDARGHGMHPQRAATTLTVQRMARDLHELIAHFGLVQPILLGHSMGALTLWEYIRQFGCAGIAKLVLVDQSPKLVTDPGWAHGIYSDFPPDRNARFIARMERDFAEAVLCLVGEGNNRRARTEYENNTPAMARIRDYLRRLEPAPLIAVWRSLTLQDYRDVLPQISVPTLMVHGDESHFYSLEVAEYVAARIPQATLHIYEGTDHSPHLWQRERFIADLRAFTREPSADP